MLNIGQRPESIVLDFNLPVWVIEWLTKNFQWHRFKVGKGHCDSIFSLVVAIFLGGLSDGEGPNECREGCGGSL